MNHEQVAGQPRRRVQTAPTSRHSSLHRRPAKENKQGMSWSGLRAALGAPLTSLALYRITLGSLLFSELVLRFNYLHPFYSDEGTLPMRLLDAEIDPIYRVVCLHCYSGSMIYEQLLLSIQCAAALCLTIGYRTRFMAIVSWFLYLSLTLRNTWLAFILDRYFHYLLFYAMLLPLGDVWSVDCWLSSTGKTKSSSSKQPTVIVSVATIALKLQIFWIYVDAGYGKFTDPLKGWTYGADPLPALDTYARHTIAARYLYAALGPFGLRLLTPTVVWVELGVAPAAFLGSWLGNSTLVWTAVAIVWCLHFGIAATIRNTVLLSLVANCAWCVFLPPTDTGSTRSQGQTINTRSADVRSHFLMFILVASFAAGSVWFETASNECNQSMKHIWSTLLHNRWNVFVGAEEYVTWEIAPGRLEDGSIVDVWGQKDYVDWDMPGSGTPCTSTARPGRWRSFPYLAELDGESGEALWSYLCRQWDTNNPHPGKRLLKFNFFMLQADVLPNMGFSATRKRLIKAYSCSLPGEDVVKGGSLTEQEEEEGKDVSEGEL